MNSEKEVTFTIKDNFKWAFKEKDIWIFTTTKPVLTNNEKYDIPTLHNTKIIVTDLISITFNGPDKDSLHQIINGRLYKYKEPIKIPRKNAKVMVRDGDSWWSPRRSSGKLDSKNDLLCYTEGRDSWTGSNNALISWKNWRLPTKEELKGDFSKTNIIQP